MGKSFRDEQNAAHPNKVNTLMSAIIVVLILIISLQIWMMYGALNNALDQHHAFACATFGGSVFMFFTALFIMRYLPEPRKNTQQKPENHYE